MSKKLNFDQGIYFDIYCRLEGTIFQEQQLQLLEIKKMSGVEPYFICMEMRGNIETIWTNIARFE